MKRLALVFAVVVMLSVGFALGIVASTAIAVPTASELVTTLQQNDPVVFPLVKVQQQDLVTVTFSVNREDGTSTQFGIPMVLNYDLDVTLTSVFTYEDVPIPPEAIRLNIANIETVAGLQYDITGIAYTAQIPNGVELVWSPSQDFSGNFMLQGTIANNDSERILKQADISVAAFNSAGQFMGINAGGRLVIPYDGPLGFGDVEEFSAYIEDVNFLDVAFYRLLVTADFDSPPPARGR